MLCKTKVFQLFLDTFEEIMEKTMPTNTDKFPESDLAGPVLGELDIGRDETIDPSEDPEELTEEEENIKSTVEVAEEEKSKV